MAHAGVKWMEIDRSGPGEGEERRDARTGNSTVFDRGCAPLRPIWFRKSNSRSKTGEKKPQKLLNNRRFDA